jgi:hypothetical protein
MDSSTASRPLSDTARRVDAARIPCRPLSDANGIVATAASCPSGSQPASPRRMAAHEQPGIIGWAGVVFMFGSRLWAFLAP